MEIKREGNLQVRFYLVTAPNHSIGKWWKCHWSWIRVEMGNAFRYWLITFLMNWIIVCNLALKGPSDQKQQQNQWKVTIDSCWIIQFARKRICCHSCCRFCFVNLRTIISLLPKQEVLLLSAILISIPFYLLNQLDFIKFLCTFSLNCWPCSRCYSLSKCNMWLI